MMKIGIERMEEGKAGREEERRKEGLHTWL